jgi:outer membrane protein assembly factor BamA
VDVGNTLFEDQSWTLENARVAVGVELRFYLPVFPVPLRLIFGTPVRSFPGDRYGTFTFSIGKSF